MRLERLKFEHLEQMAQIEREAFDMPWSVNMFIPEVATADSHYLVGVEGENEVVCYGGFHKVFDEGHIMNIAVKKEWRGKGFSRQLMNALIARAKLIGIDKMTLEVSSVNEIAQKLYYSYGFKEAGLRKGYYADGSDAIIMWTDIV